jgi:DNA-binding response OmpR family regulator
VIKGFELGADDYITKPFSLRELLVRIRAVMKRVTLREDPISILEINGVKLDPSRHEVHLLDRFIDLTPLEFQILEKLMHSAGKVLKRADLAIMLMENGYAGSEATLKIHIRNLRQKLGDTLENPRYIETVFGIGYRFLEIEA